MEKSQIFQEMISRISKLSQDSYLMVTDMQHNLTFVPESTAEFLGIPSGWCEDGYKIVLEKSVHPYDCPEYTEEIRKDKFHLSAGGQRVQTGYFPSGICGGIAVNIKGEGNGFQADCITNEVKCASRPGFYVRGCNRGTRDGVIRP